MKKKWGEIVNPSDEIRICVDDPAAAACAVLLISRGQFGLRDETGKAILPILALGGDTEATFSAQFGCSLESVSSDRLRLAAACESVRYGTAAEIEVLEAMLEGLHDAAERRAKWENAKRTSMNDIVACFRESAARLRK